MKEKKFNGIIIPTPFREGDTGTLVGLILGATARELGLGPKSLKLNYAFAKAEKTSKAGLFWLEGTDSNQRSPYSQKACYYWLIQEFSSFTESRQCAIRAMPADSRARGKVKYLDYDFIFWHKGKPVRIGQQHSFAQDTLRNIIGEDTSLIPLVRAWEKGDYEITQSRHIKDLNKILEGAIYKDNWQALDKTKHRLSIEARDATWEPGKGPLVLQYV